MKKIDHPILLLSSSWPAGILSLFRVTDRREHVTRYNWMGRREENQVLFNTTNDPSTPQAVAHATHSRQGFPLTEHVANYQLVTTGEFD